MAEQQQAAQQQPEECWFSGVEKINQRFLASFYCSRKMASLVVEMDTMIPSPQTNSPRNQHFALKSPDLPFEKRPFFFPHYWVIAQFLGSLDDSSHFGKFHREVSETFGATGISMGIFPGSFRFEKSTGRWRSYIASTHPECGQTLCRDLCKEFPTRAQSRGRVGWWVVGGWWKHP